MKTALFCIIVVLGESECSLRRAWEGRFAASHTCPRWSSIWGRRGPSLAVGSRVGGLGGARVAKSSFEIQYPSSTTGSATATHALCSDAQLDRITARATLLQSQLKIARVRAAGGSRCRRPWRHQRWHRC